MNSVDRFIVGFDNVVRTLWGSPESTGRPDPAVGVENGSLSVEDHRHVAGLMRINHCGEVCAQGLYLGQALTARRADVREKMAESAAEENDHLLWCESRLSELGASPSWLNPLWFGQSFLLGAAAGICGDKWSLGFVVETEDQVVRHLNSHLAQLPVADRKSRAVLEQMKVDEGEHAAKALAAGAGSLPVVVKKLMSVSSKVMTWCTYRV